MRLTRLMRLAVGVGVVMLAVGGGWATTATVGAQARTAAGQASQETQGGDGIRTQRRRTSGGRPSRRIPPAA